MPDNNLIDNSGDDISQFYIASRGALRERTAADELLSRYGSTPKPQTPEVPQGAKPERQNASEEDGGSVLADIGKGVIETPRAIAHGVIDAANEVIDLSQEFEDYMSSKFGTFDVVNFKFHSADDVKSGDKPEGIGDIPNLENPESTTGRMVESVSQFLTGFFTAGKLKGLKTLKPVTNAGKFGKATTQGAVADFSVFDPHAARLSDLVESVPELQNPVTEFLAADLTDSAAEGRFKNILEGLGLGVTTEAFIRGLKVVKSATQAKRIQLDQARIAGGTDEVRPQLEDGALKELGDIDLPVIANKADLPPPKETPPIDEAAKQIDDGDVFINFARIDTPDDVKSVMENMAEATKESVNEARRGSKKTFKEIELDAQQVNAWEALASRRKGDPLNAEQSVAARNLWASSADKLTAMAKKAAASGSEADLFAFRKMMSTHQTIQNEIIAARTETARALASWRIPSGSSAEMFSQIDNALMQNGGRELSREMAGRVAQLADAGMVQELDQFVSKGAWAKTRDAMLEGWINALLSGPKTHLVNMMSNTSVVFQQMYERHTAGRIAAFLGDESSVAAGEASAQFFGMVSGLRDAVRYAGKTFKTGESGFGLGKVELPMQRAIGSEALGLSSSGFIGRTVDVLGAGVNLPGRSLAAADEFFKTVGYRMELNALALRKATSEVNGGVIDPSQLKQRITEILENPPSEIRLDAIDQATYQTFTNTPGELAKLISKAKGKYPGLNIILPFVRTPANIMNYTFERTPMAPLFKHFRADVAAGGARRDLALSRMATGTAIMMVGADMAMSGQITGKGPSSSAERKALQRTGWQAYSVKVGDRYYAYNRMDPIGTTFGLSADMVDILANDDFGVEKQKSMEELAVATSMAIANNAMSKTYLSGVSDLMQAMADPERYGESFFQRLSGSVIPTGVAEVTRVNDPYMREVNSMAEAIMKRTPGLSDELPLRRNLWGEPITYQSGLGVMYDAFSPIYSKSKKHSPIDEEILKHEMNINMPNKKTSFDGATVNLENYPGAYSRFVELAGKEAKHPAWGVGAKELLDQIVTGKHPLSQIYNMKSDGPDGGKYFYVRDIMEQYRDIAKKQILEEFPTIKEEIEEKRARKLQLKMPVFGG